MSRRLVFLTGHLSGLILGGVLVFVLFSYQSAQNRPVLNVSPAKATMTPVVCPQAPEGWELRYFNGRPFYVSPLCRSAV